VPATSEETAAGRAARPRAGRARPSRADLGATIALVVGTILLWRPLVIAPATTYAGLNADTFSYFLPAYAYQADRIAGGGFPFWNPYQGAGVPFLAMVQPGALYPARLLMLLTSPARAMGWSAFAHVVLTIVGTYALCRSLGARLVPSVVGAIVFATAFALPSLTTPAALESGAWTPLLAYGVVRILRGGGWKWAVLTGAAGAMPLLAGDYQVTLYGGYAIALVALAVALEERPPARALAAAAGQLTVAGALAIATAAPQILTTYLWSTQSVRQTQGLSDLFMLPLLTEAARWSRLAGFFVRQGSSDVAYLSIPVIALATIGLVRGRRLGLVLGLGALASATLAFGQPGTLLLAAYKAIPGLRTFRFPVRIVFITSLLVALGAALGLTAIGRERMLTAPARRRVLDAAALVVVVGLLVVPYRNPWKLPWTVPASDVAPDARFFPAPVRPPDDARVFVPADRFDLRLGTFVRQGMRQRVRVLPDYDPLSAQRLDAFLSAVAGRAEPFASFAGAVPTRTIARPDLLDLAGVRGIVAPHSAIPSPGVAGWTEVATDGNLGVYTNAHALPRAYVVGRAHLVADDAAALAAITADGFDPRAEAVVVAPSEDSDARALAAAPATALVPARIVVDDPERVVVEVPAASPGVLVLADAWAPGWTVTVNGLPRTIWQVNHLVRGVRVDGDDRRVEFRYHAPGFATGLALAGVAWASVLVGLVATGRRGAFRA
jgi:hypothetical protein